MKSALPPLSGDGGDASTSAPRATNTAVSDLRPGDQEDRRADAAPEEAEQHGANGDAGEERHEDDREHVGGAAGPGADEAVPDDLVAERRQARDEREQEREPPPGGDGVDRVSVRSHDSCCAADGAARGAARLGDSGRRSTSAGEPARRSSSSATTPAVAEHSRADEQRAREAQQLDEDEARDRRPEDRPERVRGVQPLERAAPARLALGEEPGERRQGRAHDHGRRREGQDREPEADERERERRLGQRRVDALVDLADEPEADRGQQHDATTIELEAAVQPERPGDPVRDPATDRAADREAAEEAREDRRDRLARVAEHENQLAGPHDLVDEARRRRTARTAAAMRRSARAAGRASGDVVTAALYRAPGPAVLSVACHIGRAAGSPRAG